MCCPGDDGVEQVLGAEGEADHVLLALVLDEEHAHDLGGEVRVQRLHPREHILANAVALAYCDLMADIKSGSKVEVVDFACKDLIARKDR